MTVSGFAVHAWQFFGNNASRVSFQISFFFFLIRVFNTPLLRVLPRPLVTVRVCVQVVRVRCRVVQYRHPALAHRRDRHRPSCSMRFCEIKPAVHPGEETALAEQRTEGSWRDGKESVSLSGHVRNLYSANSALVMYL